jgi:hypothetical protein
MLLFQKYFRRKKLVKIDKNCDHNIEPWDRCNDFENIFAKKLAKILAFLLKLLLVFFSKMTISLVFEKTPIFSPKIGENRQKQ